MVLVFVFRDLIFFFFVYVSSNTFFFGSPFSFSFSPPSQFLFSPLFFCFVTSSFTNEVSCLFAQEKKEDVLTFQDKFKNTEKENKKKNTYSPS